MSGLFAVCGSISADMIGYAPRLPGPGESVLGDRFLLAPGGKGANVAVAAARLGASVRFFGARGDDAFGELHRQRARGRRRRRLLARRDRREHSGVALIAVDAQAENQILALPGANALVGAPSPCGAAVWFCPGEIPRAAQEGTLAAARADGALAVVNPSPPNAFDADLLARFDVAIVNETELGAFEGKLPARVVLTRGGRGAVLLPEGTELPAIPAHAVDTTGAGDAFAGGLCAGLASGAPLEAAVQLALVTAAISVERDGCQPAYAGPAEVAERAAAAGWPSRCPEPKNDEGAGSAAVRRRPLPPTPSADWRHVDGLGTLGPFSRLVLDARAIRQCAKAGGHDVRVVHEQVLSALVGRDEAVALRVVEPLHGPGRHPATSQVERRKRSLAAGLGSSHLRGSFTDRGGSAAKGYHARARDI